MAKVLKDIKPLVIGLGVAGKRHLDAQLNLGIQTGIYSLDIKKDDPLRTQKNVIVFDNLKDAIGWSNLVHVCTPDDIHTEFVALALKKGRDVLCEKSFTTNLEDALYLQKLAHENNCTLLVAQNYRLTPTFAKTKELILEGAIGKVTKIETTYLHDASQYQQRVPLRKNQDFLYIGGSHVVDLACWIIKQPVKSVKAKTNQHHPFPNSYNIVLEFTSGLLCSIKLDASSSRPYNGTGLIVEGEKGKLVSHNKVDQLLFYKKGSKKLQSIELPNNKTLTTAIEVGIVNNYLLGEKPSPSPLPDVDEAVHIIKVLDIIQKAAISGKKEFIYE